MHKPPKPTSCCHQTRLTALADARWAALHAGTAADLAGIVDSLIHQTKENKMTEHSFISSSGNTLHLDGFGNLCIDEDVALEKGDLEPVSEFFQHQRDQQLGRVRWPENPDYVIYRDESEDDEDGRCVKLLNEQTGRLIWEWEHDACVSASEPQAVAYWYFTEGPGKPERPWDDAQAGEVWRLTVAGRETMAVASRTSFRHSFDQDDVGHFIDIRSTAITAGRKIANADGSRVDDQD